MRESSVDGGAPCPHTARRRDARQQRAVPTSARTAVNSRQQVGRPSTSDLMRKKKKKKKPGKFCCVRLLRQTALQACSGDGAHAWPVGQKRADMVSAGTVHTYALATRPNRGKKTKVATVVDGAYMQTVSHRCHPRRAYVYCNSRNLYTVSESS